jgi:D-serine deaminase-like pyridoxal phosphate-dependent protein
MNEIIGQDHFNLDTPALWVDLDQMEANMHALAAYLKEAGVAWRPHTKAMKVPAIAHKMLQAGAIGITCAKLSEAEAMAAAGIQDILIANQVVGSTKITRLVNLRRSSDVMVAVENLENAEEISKAAIQAGVKIRVLVEINIGMDRSDQEPGKTAVEFAQKIAALPGLELSGVMGWEGHVLKISDPEEKRRLCLQAVQSLVCTAEMGWAAGLKMPIVSCGGSGTFQITSHVHGVTEIQAGGAVFADVAYQKWGVPFDSALHILAMVTSRPAPWRAIIDAGRKAMSGDSAMPIAKRFSGVKLIALYAEHGVLELEDSGVTLKVGDKLDFIAGYSDTTVLLHDQLYGVRKGLVETVWDIQGLGKLT